MEQEDMYRLLRAAYEKNVVLRRMEFREDAKTTENLNKVAQWLTSETMKPSLLLLGGVGNGKTTMVKAVMDVFNVLKDIAKKIEDTDTANSGTGTIERKYYHWFISAPTPIIITAQEAASIAGDTDKTSFRNTSLSPFLIIDDLGCEPAVIKNYGTEITPIEDIIYKRYDKMLPTLITTNLDKKDIRFKYGARVADRFQEIFETIGYKEASYRR